MPDGDFVADASVAIAWVHAGQATPTTQALLAAIADGAIFEVPAIWPLEVANALLVLRRRGRLTERERTAAMEGLGRLPHVVDAEAIDLAFGPLCDLGAKYGISVYDAAYIELAKRRGLPLACKDGPLLAAARRARVPIWQSR